MGAAPSRCPMCGEQVTWKIVDRTKKGFSGGKAIAGAAIGAALFGPAGLIGAAAGATGKNKVSYCCGRCGFQHEYDG